MINEARSDQIEENILKLLLVSNMDKKVNANIKSYQKIKLYSLKMKLIDLINL